ncbi:SpoIID/LytB domain-containing protein [Robertmurraya sp. 2P01SA]
MISVRLRNYIGNTSELSLRLQGEHLTLDPALNLMEGNEYKLSIKGKKLFLHQGKSKMRVAKPFILYPKEYDEEHLVYINDRPYMGAIEFQIEEKNNIRPVNQLLLEDYLKGVVPFEVFPSWDIEALKAQTLAARTYTITHKDAELDDTIHYQVYGGYNEFAKTKQAVRDTKGEIITFENKPISTFYSASNGGMTESNKNVWGGEPTPYFPIKSDPYDPIQPWSFTLDKTQIDLEEINWDDSNWWDQLEEKNKEITASMKNWLQNNGYIGDIKILSIPHFSIEKGKNESSRSVKGSFQMEFMRKLFDGTILFEKLSYDDVELKKIRPIIGGIHFKSYLISTFDSSADSYKVSGKGNGHGVGMSQWGASIMADKGKNYKEIIEHYYPGTEIEVYESTEEMVNH